MDRLDLGVERGIITPEQRDALRALDLEQRRASLVEAQRGLNAVTVAYWSGAIAVLIAFGWFMVTRWDALGPTGILIVSLVYATLFGVVARVLFKEGFRYAASIATLLVVGMTPLVAWSLLSLTGRWDLYPASQNPLFFGSFDPLWNQVRWMPIDLATILAALIALRYVRFGVLALPIAAALVALGGHSIGLFLDLEVADALGGRLPLLMASVLLTIGYALDVRTTDGEDYAVWFYLAGIGSLIAAIVGFWGESSAITAHAMLAGSVILAVAAIRLGRRILLLAAFLGFVVYLGYLAFDVFGKAVEFPVALATVGMVVILAAVWLQRRYPGLVRRGERPARRPIRGAPLALGGFTLIAMVMILAGMSDARQRIADRYWREAFERRRLHNAWKYRGKNPSPLPTRARTRSTP
jgi:hypothetical protein